MRELGTFSYQSSGDQRLSVMTSVDCVPLNGSIEFARPLRALMDLVALRKVQWSHTACNAAFAELLYSMDFLFRLDHRCDARSECD